MMHSRSKSAAPPAGPAPGPRRRGALIAIVAAAAAITTGGSATTPASAQILSPDTTTLTLPLTQLLDLPRVSPQKLKMIEEEGYLCFMAFHRVPPGISWVCVPPVQ
jgi:hypothetical protein